MNKLYVHIAVIGLQFGKSGISNDKGNRPARSETPCKRDTDCKKHEGIFMILKISLCHGITTYIYNLYNMYYDMIIIYFSMLQIPIQIQKQQRALHSTHQVSIHRYLS